MCETPNSAGSRRKSSKNQPARAFYERLGGELIAEQTFQWDGVDLVEVGYAFRDLDALAEMNADNPALH